MADLYKLPYDPKGTNSENRIPDHEVKLEPNGQRAFHLGGPFHSNSVKVRKKSDPNVELVLNKDYKFLYIEESYFDLISGPVNHIIYFFNKNINGEYLVDLQLVGGSKVGSAMAIQRMLDNITQSRDKIFIEDIVDFPSVLPGEKHVHNIADTYGYEKAVELCIQVKNILESMDENLSDNLVERINVINSKYNSLFETLTNLTESMGDSGNAVNLLIEQLNAELDDLNNQLVVLKNLVTSNKNSADQSFIEINTKHSDLKKSFDSHVSTYNSKVEAIDKKAVENATAANQNKEALRSLAGDVQRNAESISGINAAIKTLNDNLGSTDQTLSNLIDKVNDLVAFAERGVAFISDGTKLPDYVKPGVNNVVRCGNNGLNILPHHSVVKPGTMIHFLPIAGYNPIYKAASEDKIRVNIGTKRLDDTELKHTYTGSLYAYYVGNKTWEFSI